MRAEWHFFAASKGERYGKINKKRTGICRTAICNGPSFLRTHKLPEKYYDVVIFGYLESVKRYVNQSNLQRDDSFAQIANRSMNAPLLKHWKGQERRLKVEPYKTENLPVFWQEMKKKLAGDGKGPRLRKGEKHANRK